MMPRRTYLDTEFTALNRYISKLISLALVVPDGSEFYAELTDAWEEDDCSDFVREIVLSQLNLATYGRTKEQARLTYWIFSRSSGGWKSSAMRLIGIGHCCCG